jgi:hypothetical protein
MLTDWPATMVTSLASSSAPMTGRTCDPPTTIAKPMSSGICPAFLHNQLFGSPWKSPFKKDFISSLAFFGFKLLTSAHSLMMLAILWILWNQVVQRCCYRSVSNLGLNIA